MAESVNNSLFYLSRSLEINSTDILKKINMDEISSLSYAFWVAKISIFIALLSVITYFLKQSNHYQKLGDQASQTDLELKSFPSFISGFAIQEELSIRRELALKYFGRRNDGEQDTADMSSLISNQMKNTTELVKVTTDAIKALTPPKSQ